jgi:predicted ester cyclase
MVANERNVELVNRFYHDMWNRFDKAIFPELLAEDLRFRGSLGQEKRGYAEFGEYVDFIQRAFPDFHNQIEDIVSEGARSFVRLTYTGTHEGEVFGIAPTGRRIEYAGAALLSFQGDRISSAWVLGDVRA